MQMVHTLEMRSINRAAVLALQRQDDINSSEVYYFFVQTPAQRISYSLLVVRWQNIPEPIYQSRLRAEMRACALVLADFTSHESPLPPVGATPAWKSH